MYHNPRFRAFYGQPKKTLVMRDLTVEAKMSMDTFVSDVLTEFGLYLGKPLGWGAFYAEHAKIILKKSSKKIFATKPANPNMCSRSFINRYFDLCTQTPADDALVFNFRKFAKFFNLYFQKATGMDVNFGAKVLQILINGLKANLRDACDGKTHIWIEENDSITIHFKIDDELEKTFIFENKFYAIYNELTSTPEIPIIFIDAKDFKKELEKINKLSVEYKADHEMQGYLRILKKMIMEARSRGICIGVRMIAGESDEHGS